MNYKHSRKERIAKYMGDSHYELTQLLKDLLAKKEDRKECKHKFVETYTGGKRCNKCNMSLTEFKYSTPSPLDEIEEIESVHFGNDTYQTLENFYDSINKLIRNQKKLISLTKRK